MTARIHIHNLKGSLKKSRTCKCATPHPSPKKDIPAEWSSSTAVLHSKCYSHPSPQVTRLPFSFAHTPGNMHIVLREPSPKDCFPDLPRCNTGKHVTKVRPSSYFTNKFDLLSLLEYFRFHLHSNVLKGSSEKWKQPGKVTPSLSTTVTKKLQDKSFAF